MALSPPVLDTVEREKKKRLVKGRLGKKSLLRRWKYLPAYSGRKITARSYDFGAVE